MTSWLPLTTKVGCLMFSRYAKRTPGCVPHCPTAAICAGATLSLIGTSRFPARDKYQSCVRLILRNLDGEERGPVHPAECLEIAAVIENRYVLANANFS